MRDNDFLSPSFANLDISDRMKMSERDVPYSGARLRGTCLESGNYPTYASFNLSEKGKTDYKWSRDYLL